MIINLVVVGLLTTVAYFFHSPELSFIFNVMAVGSVLLGLLFFFGTSLGLLRFPDFYTRMHAAGKGDTLSSILILFGIVAYTLSHHHLDIMDIVVAVKVFLIMNFIFNDVPHQSGKKKSLNLTNMCAVSTLTCGLLC